MRMLMSHEISSTIEIRPIPIVAIASEILDSPSIDVAFFSLEEVFVDSLLFEAGIFVEEDAAVEVVEAPAAGVAAFEASGLTVSPLLESFLSSSSSVPAQNWRSC